MNNFWNERYSAEEYAYGTEPNDFLKEQLEKLTPGKILFPGEGEGRNAVFAAKKGWEVSAFDSSSEGKRKADKLAKKNKVKIDYQVQDYDLANFKPETYDVIALIYTHMNPEKRKEYHQKLITFLKPGGILILEGFSKKQIENNTGGPRNIGMLFSKEELENDFCSLQKLTTKEMDIYFKEGIFHDGNASVIRIFGMK
ncbi:methyltransferase domain-containing protein [Maribellus comscasis]|uniref:Methyltransferase domain-containing protein n=1 Tax=Maribellus comscasis TaxID=2681766 RepID=A0A6I6JY26_9BACT|nr:class I SAM-dependent methyltransferase [Maribellus comscasis]QGY42614.1 methyltransferase domain-containing protein [Maribellus comscasis]